MTKKISSVQNQLIKNLYQLKEKSKHRKNFKKFLIEGQREIELATKGGYELETLLFSRDLLSKSQGVMTTSVFTLLGTYDTLRSVIGSIVGIVVVLLISISVLVYELFLIPFGFGLPFAIPLVVMFILIAVPGIMVYIIQVMILKKMVSPIPGL